jgi:hypothetical protein
MKKRRSLIIIITVILLLTTIHSFSQQPQQRSSADSIAHKSKGTKLTARLGLTQEQAASYQQSTERNRVAISQLIKSTDLSPAQKQQQLQQLTAQARAEIARLLTLLQLQKLKAITDSAAVAHGLPQKLQQQRRQQQDQLKHQVSGGSYKAVSTAKP